MAPDATIDVWVRGQYVLDTSQKTRILSGMARAKPRPTVDSEFKLAFIERIKKRRAELGWTQAEMAQVLGLKQDRYKIYETRTVMPAEMLALYCDRTGTDPAKLLGTVPLRAELRIVR